jgi:hypothetical protein
MKRVDRHGLVIVGIWLLLSAALIITGWSNIGARAGWDPDDQLRLVQLRDFLNGQSWFDNNQYRLNAPYGAPMHWSRLVELPLAAIIYMLRPFVGQPAAEMVAGSLVPLALFGGVICLLAQIASKAGSRAAGVFAAVIAATSVPLVMQLQPMRIDHHGWQIFMAVAALASLFHANARKAGIALGVALAVWLHISLEGAPMAAAFFVYLGWRWLVSADEGKRLSFAIAGFALTSLLLFFGSQQKGIHADVFCDTVSLPHIWAIITAAVIMLPGVAAAPATRTVRVLVILLAAAGTGFVMVSLAPDCLGDAFANLDPLVREYWYANVKEGLPIWQQDGHTAAFLLAGPAIGLASCIWLLRSANAETKSKLATITFFVGYGCLLSVFVFRTVSVASAYAVVPAALIAAHLFGQFRNSNVPAVRIGTVAIILAILVPGALLNATLNLFQAKQAAADVRAEQNAVACESAASVAQLAQLPTGNMLAPFDMGPMILSQTQHRIVASSHHRNARGMYDHIRIFRSRPDVSHKLLKARAIRYLTVCAGEEELAFYAKKDPNGLWGSIERGDVPGWLEALPELGDGIKVWRVR